MNEKERRGSIRCVDMQSKLASKLRYLDAARLKAGAHYTGIRLKREIFLGQLKRFIWECGEGIYPRWAAKQTYKV
ncbi:hypothetical protein LOY35_08755 [Pseudomonas sp. B21-028]|uniref:hypothetical protein n=1 Tax=Pseudomonas sp. B21-028 TaxID=2895480 RepID=UPI0021610803|nr:hypothetical protein [Pseudomonas sp. B21-028]UVL85649.1 hypothetical protein LOY35_08755 [Pseudomonas sp. B21-028]